MQENAPQDSAPSAPAMGSGNRLRQAREARGIELQQVANELRLPVRHIEALEAEDLSRLPAASYICGYLRSYAKMVELPSDEIVVNFPGMKEYLASVKSTVMPTRMVAPLPEMVEQDSHRGINVSSAVMLIAAAVIAAILLFQLSGSDDDAAPAGDKPPAASQENITVPVPPPATAAKSPAVAQREPEPERPATEATSTAPVESTAPKEAATPVEAAPAAPRSMPLSQLVLQFRGESWIEIFDAANQRLAFELVRRGEVRTINGVAPFRVILGAASEVDVRYNDVVYDMSRYRRANLVELRIGKPQDNRNLSPIN